MHEDEGYIRYDAGPITVFIKWPEADKAYATRLCFCPLIAIADCPMHGAPRQTTPPHHHHPAADHEGYICSDNHECIPNDCTETHEKTYEAERSAARREIDMLKETNSQLRSEIRRLQTQLTFARMASYRYPPPHRRQ